MPEQIKTLMLVDERRAKLAEAIAFFVTHTRYCGLIKLFKLLYWLDYHHFRETGRDVTGLTYFAYQRGPVPTELYRQITARQGDIADQLIVEGHKRVIDAYEPPTIDSDLDDQQEGRPSRPRFVPSRITPKQPYQHAHLTKREMRIAERLAEIFNEATAEQISDISHGRNGPWQHALRKLGPKGRIDFTSSLVPMQKGSYLAEDELRERIKEQEDLRHNLS